MRWVAAVLAALIVSMGALPSWRARHRVTGPHRGARLPGRLRLVLPAAVVLGLVWATAGPVLASVLTLAGVAGRRWWRRRIAANRSRQATRAVARACEVIEAELRSGTPAQVALVRGVDEAGLVLGSGEGEPFPGSREGGPHPLAGRRHEAAAPTDSGWAQVAAGWRFAEQVGAPLADVLAALRTDMVDRLAQLDEAEVQAAGARTTGVLLALLPVLGVGLGATLGAHPLHFLTDTRPGVICLGLALALEGVGLAWLDRLVRPRDWSVGGRAALR